jgi:hypothetical protein
MPVVSGSDALFGRYGQVGCRSTIYRNFKFLAFCGYEVFKVDFRPKLFEDAMDLWRISICVLVVYKYMYRNSYFTIMAAVEYKILSTVRGEI